MLGAMMLVGFVLTCVYLVYSWRLEQRYKSLNQLYTIETSVWNQLSCIFSGSTEDFFNIIVNFQSGLASGPKMFMGWILGFPYVVLAGAEELEPLIRSRNINKSRDYNVLRNWLADGLFTNNGDSWRWKRKILTPTFHYDILDIYAETFRKQARILVRRLGERADSGEVFDIWPYFTAVTLDSICETMIGRHFNLQGSNEQSEYVRHINTLTELVRDRMQKPHLNIDCVYYRLPCGRLENKCLKYIHEFADTIIEERWEALSKTDENSNQPKRRAFLDLLIEMVKEGKLEKSEIRQEVNTFIFAGHDTSSMGLNWTTFLLGHHPQVQERAFAEISEHIKEEGDWNMENMKKLVYLESVFKEGLRLYPPGGMVARICEFDFDIKGVTIPAGTQVGFSPLAIHREAKYWPDPEVFNPDRFLPENSVGRHPYSFLPFSAGSRNCIGQRFAVLEAKILLGMIVQNFRITSVHERHEVEAKCEVVLRPDPGIFITLQRRMPKETAL